jgi:predicted transglutaminase-like cysteine proteinase
MFARTAALASAVFLFVFLAVSSAGSRGSPQHTQASTIFATTMDEQRRVQLQQSSGEVTALDATELTTLVAPPAIQHSSETEPFSLATTIVSAGPIVTMWNSMQTDIRADREALMRCHEASERCTAAAQSFLAVVAEGREHAGRARIGVINRAINLTIQAAPENRWTAPLETFSMGRGNCKQYAVAKYLALIEVGINENDVKVVIVHDLATGDNHAVVAVHLNGDWIMLDNRWLTMVQDIDIRGVVPLFVLDRHGVKRYLPTADDDPS